MFKTLPLNCSRYKNKSVSYTKEKNTSLKQNTNLFIFLLLQSNWPEVGLKTVDKKIIKKLCPELNLDLQMEITVFPTQSFGKELNKIMHTEDTAHWCIVSNKHMLLIIIQKMEGIQLVTPSTQSLLKPQWGKPWSSSPWSNLLNPTHL